MCNHNHTQWSRFQNIVATNEREANFFYNHVFCNLSEQYYFSAVEIVDLVHGTQLSGYLGIKRYLEQPDGELSLLAFYIN